jgi:ornithine cyclodeaminase/alanine dehydrogenase-like protein (mu-crystallin family)
VSAESALLLDRRDVARLLTREDCMAAVEHAFRLLGEGKAPAPGVLGVHCRGGGFHIKAGLLNLKSHYFAAKVNANFPQNPDRFELPAIQGVIVLCDAGDGRLLAVLDSTEITARRTAAATAVAAKYLARRDSTILTICGCGQQGRAQVRGLAGMFPLAKIFAYDAKAGDAQRLAGELGEELKIEVVPVADLGAAVRKSDICVTCTPSRQPLLTIDDVAPGTFIAAVGADHPEKQELDPALMAGSKVVVDSLEQCATIGDLHHAMAAGAMERTKVHAELGEVAAGKRPGRTSPEEIVIFDSTGIALQDVAAAALVYEKAQRERHIRRFDFMA